MYKILLNLVNENVLNLKIQKDNLDDKRISIVKNKTLLKSFDMTDLQEGFCEKLNDKYLLKVDGGLRRITVFDKKTNKSIFETKMDFIFENGNETGLRLDYAHDEIVIGLGQDHMANLNNRDVERRCWHQWNGYDRVGNNTVPFYLSSRGYGLFIDTTYPVRIDFGLPKVPEKVVGYELTPAPYEWEKPACENQPDSIALLVWEDILLDIYVILGEFDEILKRYYELTGFPTLLPKWAYGFIQCKNRYKSAEEVLRIAKKMREKNIPCDCIVIDWMWFKEFGDLEWDENYFSNIKETINEINKLGIQVMLAQHPFVEKGSLKYEKFNEAGCINKVPEGARPTFDHTHPNAKKVWWDEVKRLYEDGIRGYWTDMGEPEFDWPGTQSYIGPRERYHNAYTMLWSKNLYEAQREDYGTRPFILARTMYLGIQNYNTAMWSGDIFATWDVLRDNVVIGQNVSISGQPYFCTDIGGFHTDTRFTPELYLRWMQWGVFCTLFRTHGTKPENEPWSFGTEAEKLICQQIKFRYRLMPYIYSLVKQMTETGKNVVRPMIFDYKDKEVMNYPYQYMFGDILVSPVVSEGARTKITYLPEGTWYDLYTNKRYEGSKCINSYAPIDRIPAYVREGSILVTAEETLNAIDIHDKYEVTIYGCKDCSQIIYEDDGLTFDYETNKVNIIKVEAEYKNGNMIVNIKTQSNNYKPDKKLRNITLKWIKDDNSQYKKDIQYLMGDDVSIDMLSGEKLNNKVDEIEVYVDNLIKRYNGEEVIKILMINNSFDMKKLTVEIEKPSFYYASERLNFEASFIDSYEKTIVMKPFGYAMPQYEEIKVVIKEGERVIAEKIVRLGNEYIKNWKVYVEPNGIAKDDVYFECKERENNPFGYVRLLEYINMKEQGICPVDFIDITVKKGNGKAFVKLLSSEDRNAFLKIKGEKQIKLKLNGETILESDDFVIEEIVAIKLRKGENLLELELSFDSIRPWTGREFGYSVQVLDSNGNIDGKILCL